MSDDTRSTNNVSSDNSSLVDDEDDTIDPNNEWMSSKPKPKKRMFSYDWAKGTSPSYQEDN